MAKVSFTVTEEELARFKAEAESKGMSLSAWLRALARIHLTPSPGGKGSGREFQWDGRRIKTKEDLEEFFRMVEALHSPGDMPTPGWEDIKLLRDERMHQRASDA